MSVILCRPEKVTHPYFMESLGVSIYSSQELCYAMYHHPLLVMDGFVNQNLIDFIREELGMGFAALKMERWMKSGENQDELLFLFMQECNYYTTVELNRMRQKVAALRKLPPLEYARQKADYLFACKQYGKAIAVYEKILEDAGYGKTEDSFLGQVWNNLGACYARIFRFEKAMEAFQIAYGKTKSQEVLKKMFHLTCLDPELVFKERYQTIAGKELQEEWKEELEQARERAEESEEVEKLRQLFAKDPIRRMEGAAQMVEKWKQEYRSMA